MKPPAVCLDANVFLASLMPLEEGHEQALRLMEIVQEQGWAMYEPAILPSEVLSNIHRKYMEGDLSDTQKEEMEDLFFQLPLLLQWKPSLMKKASRMASKLAFKRIYDCTYLAVAVGNKIPLVTFDGELLKKGRSIYSSVLTVGEFLRSENA